jgi:DNA polymerase III epsilon subunit-like protein
LNWSSCPVEVAPVRYFDVETTGLRPDRGARITEIAVVGPQDVRFDWRAEAEEAPSDEAVARQLPRLVAQLEDGVVVGHNLSFDFRFLTYETERLLGREARLDLRFVDTLALARRVLDADRHRLADCLAAVGAAPQEPLHTALGDALATRALFRRLGERPEIETLSDAGMQRLSW